MTWFEVQNLDQCFFRFLPPKSWFEIKMVSHLRNPYVGLVRAEVQTFQEFVEEKLDFQLLEAWVSILISKGRTEMLQQKRLTSAMRHRDFMHILRFILYFH